MTKKQLSGFLASVLALLAAWGIYRPSPGPSPTPSPTPVATASPEPSSSPSATPQPLPTPPPADPCANFEATGAPWVDKPTTPSMFREHVKRWQLEAAANGFVVGDYVIGEKQYTGEVARIGRSKGFKVTNCGIADEVWVAGPGFSESFDIVTNEGLVWNQYSALVTPEAWREK